MKNAVSLVYHKKCSFSCMYIKSEKQNEHKKQEDMNLLTNPKKIASNIQKRDTAVISNLFIFSELAQ